MACAHCDLVALIAGPSVHPVSDRRQT